MRPPFDAGAINTTGQPICYNETPAAIASATDASGGDNNITYEWRHDGAAISGTNSASYSPAAYKATVGTHTFTRFAKDGTCSTATWTQSAGSYVLVVRSEFSPGAISASSATICYDVTPAEIASLAPASGGDGNISYQWRESGSDLIGRTDETYTPNGFKATPGTYTFTRFAKDNSCDAWQQSVGQYVLVVRPNFTPGAIATTGQTICHNATPAAISSATNATGGDNAIVYEWRHDGTAIAGTNSASYTPAAYKATTGTHTFTRFAKDGTCSTATWRQSTGSYVLVVRPPFDAGAINTTGQTICYDTAPANIASVAPAAGGDGTISYKWQHNGTDISGATGEAYTPTANKADAGAHTYTRFAKDNTCGAYVQSAGQYVLTVRPEFKTGAIATSGATICYNATPAAISSATNATGGDNNITYEWRHDGAPIATTNSASYTPAAYKATTGTHTFTRFAKDGTCNTTFAQSTGSYVLTVRPEFKPGAINTAGQTICYDIAPANIANTTEASGGDGSISYQWQRNGSNISGATSASYTPTAYKASAGTHAFTRLAKDGTCNTWTQSTGSYVLTVRPAFNSGAINTAGQTICYNATPANIASQSPASGGDGTISYKWQANGTDIGSATGESYSPAAYKTATGATTFTRFAKDNTCKTWVQSTGQYVLTVRPEFKPGTIATTGQTICYNITPSAITSTANASGGDNAIVYEWRHDGTAISGTNSASYTPAAYKANPGTHTFTRWAKDGTCSTATWTQSTGSYVLVVRSEFNPGVISAGASTICYNATPAAITSSSDASGGNGVISYLWKHNGSDIGSSNSKSYTPTANKADVGAHTYTRFAKDGTCDSWIQSSGQYVLTVAASVTTPNPSAATICYNTTAAFNLGAASGGIGGFTYKWEQSDNGTSWATATGTSTNATYTSPALTADKHYHRIAMNSCTTVTSSNVLITVRPEFKAGAIATAGQTICYDATPAAITSSTDASGGDNAIVYEWRRNGTAIGSTNNKAYTPTANKANPGTHSFTRFAHDGTCNKNWVQSTGTYVLTVASSFTQPHPSAGSACYNKTATLSLGAASGGVGNTTYKWQESTNNSSWTDATGTRTNAAYTTPNITGDRYYRRVAMNSCGTITSNSAKISVAPEVTQPNPAAQTICHNTAATLSLGAASGGAGGFTYRWEQSANNSSWADATGTRTNAAYTTPALTSNMYYRRVAINSCATITSNVVLITVRPQFTAGAIASGASTICYNGTAPNIANSTAASGGDGNITYEWRRSGTAIGSTNNAAYTPTQKTSVGAATFTRFAHDGTCNTGWTQSSNQYVLTVAASFTQPHPSAGSACYNKTATLSLGAASGGVGNTTYQWQQSTDNSTWANATGTSTNAAYTTPNITGDRYYRRVAMNSCGTITSNSAKITVAPEVTQPNPAAQTICHNTAATLSLGAASGGAGGFTYRWEQSANNSSWADATGTRTNAAYTTPALTSNMYYRRVAINSCATITSNVVLITVRPQFTAGAISTTAQTICYGATPAAIANSTAASGGDGNITYQWRRNGSTTITNNAAAYTPTAYNTNVGAGTYTRFAHDGTCNTGWTQSTGSNVVTVASSFTQPNPSAVTICRSTTTTLSLGVASGGIGSITYQWQQSTDNSTWANATGTSTGQNYTTPALTTNTYYRRVAKSASCPAATTTVALVTVRPQFTAGAIASGNSTICYGATAPAIANSTVASGGDGNITYQWRRNGTAIGSTNSTAYTPTQTTSTGAATFTRWAHDGTCNTGWTQSSNQYVLTVAGSFTQPNPSAVTICRSTTTTLSLGVASGGSGAITYQWQSSSNNSDWTNISGATSQNYTTPALTGDTYYRRTAKSANCPAINSNSAKVTVRPAFTAGAITAGNSTICYGTAAPAIANSTVASGGDGNITYEWRRNGTAIGSTNSTAYTPTQTTSTGAATFTRWAHDGTCNTGWTQSSNQYVLTVAGSFTQGNPTAVTICYGKSTSLPLAAPTGGKGNLSYNWQQSPNGNDSWANATGTRNGVNYTTPVLSGSSWYRRQSISDCGTITSTGAKVTVLTNFTTGSIATTGQTICSGAAVNTITSSGAASGGSGTISYQWRRNGSDISGATAATYAPTAYNATAGAQTFTRWTKDSGCSTTLVQSAGQWVLTVIATPATPAQPTSNSPQCAGTAITFSGTVPANTTGLDWNGSVSNTGTTRATGTTAGTYQARARAYTTLNSVTCYGAYSSYSAVATILAIPSKPSAAPTQNGPQCQGTAITFSATVPSGAGGLEWNGSVSGEGTSKTSSTAGGTYQARVRAFNKSGTKYCYSDYTAYTAGTVIAKPGTPPAPAHNGPVCEQTALIFTTIGPSSGTFTGLEKEGSSSVAVSGTYQARTRAYSTVGSKTCYGDWGPWASSTVVAKPAQLNSIGSIHRCAGTAVTIRPTPVPAGGTIRWEIGSSSFTAQTYTLPYSGPNEVIIKMTPGVPAGTNTCYGETTSMFVRVVDLPFVDDPDAQKTFPAGTSRAIVKSYCADHGWRNPTLNEYSGGNLGIAVGACAIPDADNVWLAIGTAETFTCKHNCNEGNNPTYVVRCLRQ